MNFFGGGRAGREAFLDILTQPFSPAMQRDRFVEGPLAIGTPTLRDDKVDESLVFGG